MQGGDTDSEFIWPELVQVTPSQRELQGSEPLQVLGTAFPHSFFSTLRILTPAGNRNKHETVWSFD